MSAPDHSAVVAQRLHEAAQIESEWNEMSYKDRAAWWMSAKWYGYQSAEAYRRGDDARPNESCRYGEPGFFIATRVPYFEAQAAVAEVVATAAVVEPVATPDASPSTVTPPPTESVAETVAAVAAVAAVAEPVVAADQAANILREAAATIVEKTTTQPNNSHKKKKKNKRSGSTGAGKTIEISVGR
jgi:hypothetical protein